MSITLYTAPDCLRCKIVKGFLAERGTGYETVDFKEDATTFNAFYRANRKAIYRNPEGIEFPLFDDGKTMKQGSGEIIAYLLTEHALESAVTRSDLLHGWISGLYLSQCPPEQEEAFVTLVQQLAKGGLTVYVQSDGRNPALLEHLIKLEVLTRVQINILGPASAYENLFGSAPSKDELARTLELAKSFPDHDIRFLATPLPDGDTFRWPTRDEVKNAAQMVFEACNDHQLPFAISQVTAEMPQDLHGLEPVPDAMMLKYRSGAREYLFKADIRN